MKLSKLFKNVIQHQQDNSLIAIAVITGLTAGAVISVLFSPRSGRENRKRIAKTFLNQGNKASSEVKDPIFDDLRETTRAHALHLQGSSHKKKDPTKIQVPSAGTSAWKMQRIERH